LSWIGTLTSRVVRTLCRVQDTFTALPLLQDGYPLPPLERFVCALSLPRFSFRPFSVIVGVVPRGVEFGTPHQSPPTLILSPRKPLPVRFLLNLSHSDPTPPCGVKFAVVPWLFALCPVTVIRKQFAFLTFTPAPVVVPERLNARKEVPFCPCGPWCFSFFFVSVFSHAHVLALFDSYFLPLAWIVDKNHPTHETRKRPCASKTFFLARVSPPFGRLSRSPFPPCRVTGQTPDLFVWRNPSCAKNGFPVFPPSVFQQRFRTTV